MHSMVPAIRILDKNTFDGERIRVGERCREALERISEYADLDEVQLRYSPAQKSEEFVFHFKKLRRDIQEWMVVLENERYIEGKTSHTLDVWHQTIEGFFDREEKLYREMFDAYPLDDRRREHAKVSFTLLSQQRTNPIE